MRTRSIQTHKVNELIAVIKDTKHTSVWLAATKFICLLVCMFCCKYSDLIVSNESEMSYWKQEGKG